jgi:hypothetical protein
MADLDRIVEEGGFSFKETHYSGDKLEDGASKKVLELLWRVSQAQNNPFGFISPFMFQFKVTMRSLCTEEGKVVD